MAKVRPTLRKGMSGKKGTDVGEAILLWRKFLGNPELQPVATVTVYDFGTLADKYTKEWQKLAGLKDDGVVGPKSWAMYEGNIAGAPIQTQVKAAVAEGQAERNKANAMIAAVIAKQPISATPTTAPTTPVEKAKAKAKAAVTNATASVKTTATDAKAAVQQAAATIKSNTDKMPLWARILSAGVLGLGALIGVKAVVKRA